MSTPLLSIHNLDVRFGTDANPVRAVRGIDLTLEEGQSLGIVGESGSGKSTVLRAVCGLSPIHSGTCLLDGQALNTLAPEVRARLVQMIFQDPFGALHPRQSVDEQLREPMRIHRMSDLDQRVAALLQQVALGPELRFRYPHQLSGGQRQRVCIARALALEPKLLLLDEPTSALDMSVQAEVLRLLAHIREQRGMSYLFVSHDLAVVAQLCDRIAIMQEGQVVEIVTAAALRAGVVTHAYSATLLNAARQRHRLGNKG
ncbi:MAG: ABC transporter ATP-binding protein [Betaproteobacteria bacterium]|nr:ABC transporter ATP-binding protein [Betaproteobacteria bacterium]